MPMRSSSSRCSRCRSVHLPPACLRVEQQQQQQAWVLVHLEGEQQQQQVLLLLLRRFRCILEECLRVLLSLLQQQTQCRT